VPERGIGTASAGNHLKSLHDAVDDLAGPVGLRDPRKPRGNLLPQAGMRDQMRDPGS
jgi:hypothetical protein